MNLGGVRGQIGRLHPWRLLREHKCLAQAPIPPTPGSPQPFLHEAYRALLTGGLGQCLKHNLSQAWVGLPSASLWVPRWQVCVQLNGSSVPSLTPHPFPGSLGHPPRAGAPRATTHGARSGAAAEMPVEKAGRVGTHPGHKGPFFEARPAFSGAYREAAVDF